MSDKQDKKSKHAVQASKNEPLDNQHLEAFKAVVESRRSVRKFTDREIPDEVLQDCLDMALLAPSSSNFQPWEFIVIESPELRAQANKICMNQNAARTANKLIACIARTDTWEQHSKDMLEYYPIKPVPKIVQAYYGKLAPLEFKLGFFKSFVPIKWSLVRLDRLKGKSMPEPRYNLAGIKHWATTSASLAIENLMLAFRAHGFDTCPMGGFDEGKLKQLLGLHKHQHVLMVIGAGERADDGIYHEQFRFEKKRFVKTV